MEAIRLTYHNQELLLVANGNKWILAHSDLVHYSRNEGETVTLEYMDLAALKPGTSVRMSDIEHKQELNFDQLLVFANQNPVTKDGLADWIHYFGIKSRVKANYNLFKKSLREIGVNPDDLLPKWS